MSDDLGDDSSGEYGLKSSIAKKIMILVFGGIIVVALGVGGFMDHGIRTLLLDRAHERLDHQVAVEVESFNWALEVLERDARFLLLLPEAERIYQEVSSETKPRVLSSEVLTLDRAKARLTISFAEMLKMNPDYQEIRFVRTEGGGEVDLLRAVRFGSAIQTDAESTPPLTKVNATLLASFQPGSALYSDVVVIKNQEKNENLPLILSYVPIFVGDGFFGYLSIAMNLQSRITKFLKNLPRDMEPLITDSKGKIIAASFHDSRLSFEIGKTEIQEQFPQIDYQSLPTLRGNSLIFNVSQSGYESYIAYLRPVRGKTEGSNANLVLGILIDRNQLYAEYRDLQMKSFLMVLVLSLFGALIAVVIANQITNPLEEITHGVERFALGDHEVELPTHLKNEVGILARTFSKMVDQVQHKTKELTESREQFRLIFKRAPTAIALFDRSFRYLIASDRWLHDYHLDPLKFLGRNHFELLPEFSEKWSLIHQRCLKGEVLSNSEDSVQRPNGTVDWIKWEAHPWYNQEGAIEGIMMFTENISQRKRGEAELLQLHNQLVESSRSAGMAEVASSILHNVGNVLNTINVSINILPQKIASMQIEKVAKLDQVLGQQEDLSRYLTEDGQGKHFYSYFHELTRNLLYWKAEILSELQSVESNFEHVVNIVNTQQGYASEAKGIEDLYSVNDVVEDSLKMVEAGLARHKVKVIKELAPMNQSLLNKHKVIQVLVNLLVNAKDSLEGCGQEERKIRIRSELVGDRIRLEVIDNGSGISEENRNQIFRFGFTTKVNGHGFGLHNSAVVAKEMGGELSCHSMGIGRGATFIFEIPFKMSSHYMGEVG